MHPPETSSITDQRPRSNNQQQTYHAQHQHHQHRTRTTISTSAQTNTIPTSSNQRRPKFIHLPPPTNHQHQQPSSQATNARTPIPTSNQQITKQPTPTTHVSTNAHPQLPDNLYTNPQHLPTSKYHHPGPPCPPAAPATDHQSRDEPPTKQRSASAPPV